MKDGVSSNLVMSVITHNLIVFKPFPYLLTQTFLYLEYVNYNNMALDQRTLTFWNPGV